MAFVLKYAYFFSDFLHFEMSLLLLTVTLRGVSNKQCLLSLFSLELKSEDKEPTVFIDLRNFDEVRQQQQQSIEKVQKVLGINPNERYVELVMLFLLVCN